MFIEITPRQQQLQQDVRNYMAGIMTAEMRREMSNPEYFEGGGPVFREQLLRMGADGWVGLSWTESRGGKNWDPIEQYIFTNEVIRAGFPYPFLTRRGGSGAD